MEQTAILKNVGIGMRDRDKPCLWFDAYTSEGSASLQILNWDEAHDAFEDSGVYDVKQLEGKPCIVDYDAKLHISRFVRMWRK